MKYVVRNEISTESVKRAPDNVAAHRARLKEFHSHGVLLIAGPVFGPGGKSGPPENFLGIFTPSEAAKEFVKGDPFMLNGVAVASSIQEWNEVLA